VATAVLRLVQNWENLKNFDLHNPNLKQDAEWQTFVRKIKYVVRLCGRPQAHDCTITHVAVFPEIWDDMSTLIMDAPWPQKHRVGQALKGLLEEVHPLIDMSTPFGFKLGTNSNSDMFYINVEDMRDEALEKRDAQTARTMDV
jgi:hypothetical protein